jgi:hypothetical protein
MGKKIVALILSAMVTSSMVACTSASKKSETVKEDKAIVETELSGVWSKDYTRDEVKGFYDDMLTKVEEVASGYGLEYELKEEIKDENGKSVNDNYIYLDIENPEANRLESMYFGFRQFGSDLASGMLCMKIGFNLDKDVILKDKGFKFEDTSLAAFSESFTGNSEREYTELNKKIYDMIMGNAKVETIENNLEGIRETISITDNFLLYKLETKEYSFK